VNSHDVRAGSIKIDVELAVQAAQVQWQESPRSGDRLAARRVSPECSPSSRLVPCALAIVCFDRGKQDEVGEVSVFAGVDVGGAANVRVFACALERNRCFWPAALNHSPKICCFVAVLPETVHHWIRVQNTRHQRRLVGSVFLVLLVVLSVNGKRENLAGRLR